MAGKNISISYFTLGPFENNMFVVACPVTKRAAVIDPGMESEPLLRHIRDQQYTLELIINTHGHMDHSWGDYYFKTETGAPVIIHEEDVFLLRNLKEWGRQFGFEAPPPVDPDGFMVHGGTLKVGELEFKVIHTPGHSPGGVCLYGYGVVFAGDTLFCGSIGRTDLPGGSYNQLISSIKERLFALPDDTQVLCGHGPFTTIGEEKRFNPFVVE